MTGSSRPDGGAAGPGKDRKMTRLEQLEKRKADAEKLAKDTKKEIARLKREEKRKAEQAAKEKEQAEAVGFLRYCKWKAIPTGENGNGEAVYEYVYDWLMREMAEDVKDGAWKPGG